MSSGERSGRARGVPTPVGRGGLLTLQGRDGTLFYFDVGALKYVEAPPTLADAPTAP